MKIRVMRIEGKMNGTDFKRIQNNGSKSKRSCVPDGKPERPTLKETGKERQKSHRRICAWCGLVMQQGKEPASHGICRDCVDLIFDEFQVAEDLSDPFCEACSGPWNKQKCLSCRIYGTMGGVPIGKTIIEQNCQDGIGDP